MASTIRDVARMAKVSPSTVSAVINSKGYVHADTRKRVLDAVKHLNYTPSRSARNLTRKTSGNIGFIVDDKHFTKSEQFYTRVFLGTEFQARNNDLYVLLTSVSENDEPSERVPRFLREQNVDGVIIAGEVPEYVVEDVVQRKIPAVFVDYGKEGLGVPSIMIDNQLGTRIATRYLIENDHTRIGYIGGNKLHPSARERFEGYRQALEEANLHLDSSIVALDERISSVDLGEEAFSYLWGKKPPSAVVCFNDSVALGVMRAARKLDLKVPEHLSVVGFDDIDSAWMMDPPLTTIRVNKEDLGTIAVKRLVDLLKGGNEYTVTTRVGVRLKIRSSTAKFQHKKFQEARTIQFSKERSSLTAPKPYNRRLFMTPGEKEFEQRAVLNPSIWSEGEKHHMLYRAVAPNLVSTIGYAVIEYENDEPVIKYRADEPILKPRYEYDREGVEDPRVEKFEDKLYMFYTSYDGYNATTALVEGDSITGWGEASRVGPLFTNGEALKMIAGKPALQTYADVWKSEPDNRLLWEKDMCVLPRRVDGKIVCIHRLRPDIQIAYMDSMDQLSDQGYWEDYMLNMEKYLLLKRQEEWEKSHIGLGAVPIETPYGWLVIYHGVNLEGGPKTYRAGAMLLDLDDPQKVIGKTKAPLFEPIEQWERSGDVDNVVFPEGLVVRDNVMDIYYGGADSMIGVISVRMDHLVDFLRK